MITILDTKIMVTNTVIILLPNIDQPFNILVALFRTNYLFMLAYIKTVIM